MNHLHSHTNGLITTEDALRTLYAATGSPRPERSIGPYSLRYATTTAPPDGVVSRSWGRRLQPSPTVSASPRGGVDQSSMSSIPRALHMNGTRRPMAASSTPVRGRTETSNITTPDGQGKLPQVGRPQTAKARSLYAPTNLPRPQSARNGNNNPPALQTSPRQVSASRPSTARPSRLVRNIVDVFENVRPSQPITIENGSTTSSSAPNLETPQQLQPAPPPSKPVEGSPQPFSRRNDSHHVTLVDPPSEQGHSHSNSDSSISTQSAPKLQNDESDATGGKRKNDPLTSQQSKSFPASAADDMPEPPQPPQISSNDYLIDFKHEVVEPTLEPSGTHSSNDSHNKLSPRGGLPSLSNSGWTVQSGGSGPLSTDEYPVVKRERKKSAAMSWDNVLTKGGDLKPIGGSASDGDTESMSSGSNAFCSRSSQRLAQRKWDPHRAWLLFKVYVNIKLMVQAFKRRFNRQRRTEDAVDSALQQYDSSEWMHIFEISGYGYDGVEFFEDDVGGEMFIHLSTTHLYLRQPFVSRSGRGYLVRLCDISRIEPTAEGLVLHYANSLEANSFFNSQSLTASQKEVALEKPTSDEDVTVKDSGDTSLAASGMMQNCELHVLTEEGPMIAFHILEFQSRILRSYATTLSSSLRLKSLRVLHIVHFNDVYHLPPFKPAHCKGIVGGASRFHTVLAEMRKTVNPLVLFSGDFMGPSLMSVITKGKQMVDALNFLGVRYGCYGNHEFDFGLKVLKEVIHGYTKGKHIYPGSQTTWIMSNMKEPDGTPLGGAKPYEICTWQGVTVGLLGLCENWLPQCANLHPTEASYSDIFETGERMAQELKQKGCEIVLALTHNRYALDKELAERCPSIDYLLGGHDHFYKNDRAHRLVKSGQEFEYLTKIEVVFPANEKPKFKIACNPITYNIEESDYMKGLIERYDAKMAEKLGKVIGKTEIPLDSTEETVRFKEGHLTNFILDVIQASFDTDFAILGAAAIAGKEVKEPGYVTMGDVFGWFPNETKIMTVRMKGSTIKKTLDCMVRELPAEAPSFPHPSKQLQFTINLIFKPPVTQDIFVKGKPLDMDAWYTVAVEDFVGMGKAKYKHVKEEAEVIIDEDDAQQVVLQVLDYFQNRTATDDLELSSRDNALRNVTKVASSAAHIGVDMDMEKSQKFIRSLICELMHCDRSSIFLVDFQTDELHFIPDGAPNEIRFPSNVGLAGYVCTNNNHINIDDVYDDPRFNQAVDKKTGYRTKSMLACPVILDGSRCSAVVQAINKDPSINGGCFDDVDTMMLRLLGEQVGFQLINQSIFQRAQAHPLLKKNVLTVFKRMTSDVEEDIESAILALTKYARETIKSDTVKLLYYDKANEEWISTEEGIDDEDAVLCNAPCERGTIANEVLVSGESVCANDLAVTKRAVLTKSIDVTAGSYRNALLVPIVSNTGDIIGVVLWADKRAGFTDEDSAVGKFFTELAAVTLQNGERLEVLTQASHESALVSVPLEKTGRIIMRGGWATIRKFLKKARDVKKKSTFPTTIEHLYSIGNPAMLLDETEIDLYPGRTNQIEFMDNSTTGLEAGTLYTSTRRGTVGGSGTSRNNSINPSGKSASGTSSKNLTPMAGAMREKRGFPDQ